MERVSVSVLDVCGDGTEAEAAGVVVGGGDVDSGEMVVSGGGLVVATEGIANGLRYASAVLPFIDAPGVCIVSSWSTVFPVTRGPSSRCLPLDLPLPDLLKASWAVFDFFAIDLVRDSSSEDSSSFPVEGVSVSFELEPLLCSFRLRRLACGILEVDAFSSTFEALHSTTLSVTVTRSKTPYDLPMTFLFLCLAYLYEYISVRLLHGLVAKVFGQP